MDKEAVLKCKDEDLRSLGLKVKRAYDMPASILHTAGGITER